ncbi:hypothetical protein KOY48_01625 [Candidatus Minimicrobia naudis]|uniref:Uncharacterized protein n=1 Tax=Candidatus Minimicrobia naudis TaxID=2841263 RepID=A0A8F1MCS7_9BACT|nr:hypothetical protein KOY48_01625 [Candidatus Minimicrobia naudis]
MSVLTLAVLAIIIFLSRHELVKARKICLHADLWLLFLLLPFPNYRVLRWRRNDFLVFNREKIPRIHHISRLEQTRIALELNLVNHIFPSGGVRGISYTTWRMHKLGVSSARSTFAQVIRYVTGFLALLVLLVIAVLALAIDGKVNRYIVDASFLLIIV